METIHAGTCECGAGTVQLFRTGKCAHCYIADLERELSEAREMEMLKAQQCTAERLRANAAEQELAKARRCAS